MVNVVNKSVFKTCVSEDCVVPMVQVEWLCLFVCIQKNKNIIMPSFYSNTAELLSIVSMHLIFYFIYLSIFVVEVMYLEL